MGGRVSADDWVSKTSVFAIAVCFLCSSAHSELCVSGGAVIFDPHEEVYCTMWCVLISPCSQPSCHMHTSVLMHLLMP